MFSEPAPKKPSWTKVIRKRNLARVHLAAENTHKSQPSISALPWAGGSPNQAFRPPSTERLISSLPAMNPKPSAPYTWPLFVSFCIQGVVTAAPKTVAFWAGTVIQRSQPCVTGSSEGGLAKWRGLKGLRSRVCVCHQWPWGTGSRAPSYPHSWQPGILWTNSPNGVFTNMEGGNAPEALDVTRRTLAPQEPAKRI